MLIRRCPLHLITVIFIGLVLSPWANPRATYAQSMTITFDDVSAPCHFRETAPLTTRYAAQGVTFSGPDAQSGGAILNECSNFSVSGYSPPNFLAFNDAMDAAYPSGGTPTGPETITFTDPVTTVSMMVGSAKTGTATLTAYDGATQVAQQTIVLSPELTPLAVHAPSITHVSLSYTSSQLVVDDLTWTLAPPPESNVPDSVADCRNGGWRTHTRADGSPFKNQGDCIQYVKSGK